MTMAAIHTDRAWEFTRLLNFDNASPRVSRDARDWCHVVREAAAESESALMREILSRCDDGQELSSLSEAATRSLLGQAVERGDAKVVTLLMNVTPVRDITYRGVPLLHLAVSQGHDHVAEVLVDAGADVDGVNSLGETALWCAMTRRKSEVKAVTWLIERGASVNRKSTSGKTPLHVAASCCSEAVRPLAAGGADVSAREGCRGDTPLHVACTFCHQEAVWALLQAGAHAHAENWHGETPLAKLLTHAHSIRDFHARLRRNLAYRLIGLGFRFRSCDLAANGDSGRAIGRDKVSDVHRMLSTAQAQTPSLQQLCRLVVREQLPVRYHVVHVRQLEIPRHLQDFLCFRK